MLGLAVGDAVGTAVEFKPPGTFAPVTDMVGGGPFGLPVGAWTDDTSMALCLAESLVERGGFDPVDQLERYVRWWREGYLSSIGRCFDIGGATSAALQRFEKTGEPFPGDAYPNAAGNGPLMKLAPVPLAYAERPAEAVARAAESTRTTHGAAQAIDASRYFAGLLVGALDGTSKEQLLGARPFEPAAGLWEHGPLHPEVAEVAGGSFREKQPPAIRGVGYIVGSLEAALWALLNSESFEEGTLLAVNLGEDADTTAAIYGQLAGALYGVDAIPPKWREQLVMRDRIEALADGLYELSLRGPSEPVSPSAADGSPEPETSHPPGDSYWVLPGQLLAGPYPGAPRRSAAAEKLRAFLDAGVTCFVDLTEEGEGPPLHPYAALLRKVAQGRDKPVTYVRLPIRDVDVPSAWQMRAILKTIQLALGEGEVVYVHCWGGVGRTGTVVGCFLIEDGMPASSVLDHLRELRTHTDRANRTSPETAAQRSFIESWTGQNVRVNRSSARVPSRGEIAAMLRDEPVVISGPDPSRRIQAVPNDEDGVVRVEVLTPDGDAVRGLGFVSEQGDWVRICEGEHRVSEAAEVMLRVAARWGLTPSGLLTLDDVPAPDADWTDIGEFAQLTFNGYTHFGEKWGERTNAIRERFLSTGELPDDVDDLRGALFCEFRMDRFTWGDEVTLTEPDEAGVRHIVNNPDFDRSPTQKYRRAVIARIRELLAD